MAGAMGSAELSKRHGTAEDFDYREAETRMLRMSGMVLESYFSGL